MMGLQRKDGFPLCPLSCRAFPSLWCALCPQGGVTHWTDLSFPSLPSHVWCRCNYLVSRVCPPRDHHHELRLLPVHGLDRLCPLPLWWLCHRLLLRRCPDIRWKPFLLRLGIQLPNPREECSCVSVLGMSHGCHQMLWLLGLCALGLLLLTLTTVRLPGGDLEKRHKMFGSLKCYCPRLFPSSLERKLQTALPLGPPHLVLVTCPIFLEQGWLRWFGAVMWGLGALFYFLAPLIIGEFKAIKQRWERHFPIVRRTLAASPTPSPLACSRSQLWHGWGERVGRKALLCNRENVSLLEQQ